MLAFSINKNEVYNTVGNLKHNKAVAIDGVSARVLKTSVPIYIFLFLLNFQIYLCQAVGFRNV